MKHLLFLMMLTFSITSCSKNIILPADAIIGYPPSDYSVFEYIDALRANSYNYTKLPKFGPEDISDLLPYADDRTVITKFPENPLSSYTQQETYIGFAVLWTVEQIRINYPYAAGLEFDFPSQNSVVSHKNQRFEPAMNPEALSEISQDYGTWWMNAAQKSFETVRLMDPLAESPYGWH